MSKASKQSDTQVPRTADGFLLDSELWTPGLAEVLAASTPITLSEAHWEIINYMRSYYQRFRHLPNNRMFVKAVQKELGDEKGNSRYLNGLFPGSPVKWACLIAGLPKPPGCL